MTKVINWIVTTSLKHQIISEKDEPWFRYGIEKRLTTIITGIPFFTLAILLTNFLVACVFLFSFYILRSRMNGYHEKKFLFCFIHSLLLESILLLLIFPVLNQAAIYVISPICTIGVFILAPYNHPNMHYSKKELYACKMSSRIRITIITICSIAACLWGYTDLAKGITLGSMMAVYLLCLAYLRKGGKRNE